MQDAGVAASAVERLGCLARPNALWWAAARGAVERGPREHVRTVGGWLVDETSSCREVPHFERCRSVGLVGSARAGPLVVSGDGISPHAPVSANVQHTGRLASPAPWNYHRAIREWCWGHRHLRKSSRRHCACMHSVAQHGARFDLVGAVTKVFEDVDTSWSTSCCVKQSLMRVEVVRINRHILLMRNRSSRRG